MIDSFLKMEIMRVRCQLSILKLRSLWRTTASKGFFFDDILDTLELRVSYSITYVCVHVKVESESSREPVNQSIMRILLDSFEFIHPYIQTHYTVLYSTEQNLRPHPNSFCMGNLACFLMLLIPLHFCELYVWRGCNTGLPACIAPCLHRTLPAHQIILQLTRVTH